MPQPFELDLRVVGDSVVVSYGGAVMSVYERGDRGLRNLAIVALTRAGCPGVKVAALFEVRPEHVSRLRRQADEGGSQALVPPMGAPPKLGSAEMTRVYKMADEGRPTTEIAAELGVSAKTIHRRLKARPKPDVDQLDLVDAPDIDDADDVDDHQADNETGDGETGDGETGDGETGDGETGDGETGDGETGSGGVGSIVARICSGSRDCRYAGAMLLHGFFDRVGAGAVLAALPSGPARRYDASSLMLSATFGFALGVSSAEGTKHLLGSDAGALVGLGSFPHLRTLRPRLSALADAVDPLTVQTALAKAMLDADDIAPDLFFVDDHFVAYTGSAPVAKGWNTRRRHAEAGRDDTVVVDDLWRAVCFMSQSPSGLSKTMWAPLDQLRRICGERRITIGFDRGGAYPAVFAELARLGFDWVTYRRAPLATPDPTAKRYTTVTCGRSLELTDETVVLDNVGKVHQISIWEGGRVALQILTSDHTTNGAVLAQRLRHRWCIENTFKYLEDHQGIHWLCDYRKHTTPDTAPAANPARRQANTDVKAAEKTVAGLEQTIGSVATTTSDDLADTNHILAGLTAELEAARAALVAAKTGRKDVPAKLPANVADPGRMRADLHTNRRHLQMVCRLLAYNAELDLARNLNNYLDDPDEYRAITRTLLHQPGTINYTPAAITVTIRRPDAPRIAHALELLTAQLNANPPSIAGDTRRITYQIGPKP
jgi:hypothetical protein